MAKQLTYKRIDDVEAKNERDAYWKAFEGAAPSPVQRLEAEPERGKATDPYRGRIFAIVDRESASSGESAADALRSALRATVVGERTSGLAEFGDVRPWIMPRTAIAWNLPSKRNYYPEPREAVGLPVDVYLEEPLMAAPVDELASRLEKMPRAKRGTASP